MLRFRQLSHQVTLSPFVPSSNKRTNLGTRSGAASTSRQCARWEFAMLGIQQVDEYGHTLCSVRAAQDLEALRCQLIFNRLWLPVVNAVHVPEAESSISDRLNTSLVDSSTSWPSRTGDVTVYEDTLSLTRDYTDTHSPPNSLPLSRLLLEPLRKSDACLIDSEWPRQPLPCYRSTSSRRLRSPTFRTGYDCLPRRGRAAASASTSITGGTWPPCRTATTRSVATA